jgi:hypothetical protein
MYVFSYNPQTLAFQGGIPAEFDQLEPGRLICPAFCSRTPIPRFDAVNEWPFYVADPADPEAGSWELRKIEKEPTTEPEKPTDPGTPAPEDKADAIVKAIQIHLQAVENLRAQMAEMKDEQQQAADAAKAAG